MNKSNTKRSKSAGPVSLVERRGKHAQMMDLLTYEDRQALRLNKYEEAYTEFEKTKIKISIISGTILPPTICQICLEHQVEYFLDPCGHTICKHCKVICENKPDCHYCRTKKKGYKRLYL